MFAAGHVLFYHRGTWNQTICYSRDFHENPKVSDTQGSHTGYVLMMNGGPSSWKSQRQNNAPEVEFVAVSQAGQEAMKLRETLHDCGYSHTKATLLCEENLPCIAMIENTKWWLTPSPRACCHQHLSGTDRS